MLLIGSLYISFLVLVYCLLKTASDADDRMDELFNKYKEEFNKDK